MSDLVDETWVDAHPAVYAYMFRAIEAMERDRVAAGDVVVRGLAIRFGSEIWDRRINLGKTPSRAQVREAIAKLTADALTALEGHR